MSCLVERFALKVCNELSNRLQERNIQMWRMKEGGGERRWRREGGNSRRVDGGGREGTVGGWMEERRKEEREGNRTRERE